MLWCPTKQNSGKKSFLITCVAVLAEFPSVPQVACAPPAPLPGARTLALSVTRAEPPLVVLHRQALLAVGAEAVLGAAHLETLHAKPLSEGRTVDIAESPVLLLEMMAFTSNYVFCFVKLSASCTHQIVCPLLLVVQALPLSPLRVQAEAGEDVVQLWR